MATMHNGDGFRLGWNGEVFAYGVKVGRRWHYQGLHLDIRAMGSEQRARVRVALAHLVKHLRKSGETIDVRDYRRASGSRRRGAIA